MRYANSALAANMFLRSAIGAAFPLFATYMYNGLGVNWATSVLGFVAVALAPVPIIFFVRGAKIRKTSRFYIAPI
jgi:DHA1 family multidrug resistance protein-like MFS transporter